MAAARARFGTATAHRIEAEPRRPSEKRKRRGRRRRLGGGRGGGAEARLIPSPTPDTPTHPTHPGLRTSPSRSIIQLPIPSTHDGRVTLPAG